MLDTILPLSRNELKYVRSLALKKVRDAEGVFVAEGPRMVEALLGIVPCTMLLVHINLLEADAARYAGLLLAGHVGTLRCLTTMQADQASSLRAPQGIVGIFEQPTHTLEAALRWPEEGLCVALDGVQDPGNVGTILRTAAWMGIRGVVLSTTSADPFAPKTVQATMGALAHLPVLTTSLPEYLSALPATTPVVGTSLDGENLYAATLPQRGIIVMGSEGRGLTVEVQQHLTQRLRIPTFPANSPTAPESLNVATATAIVLGEMRRREGSR